MAEEETRMNARRLFYTAGRLDSDVPHQKGFFMIYFFAFTKQSLSIVHAKGQNGSIQLSANQR